MGDRSFPKLKRPGISTNQARESVLNLLQGSPRAFFERLRMFARAPEISGTGFILALALLVAVAWASGSRIPPANAAGPVDYTFTYQGRLDDGTGPVSGTYDFRFSLWDAVSGGNQVGNVIAADDLSVNDGYFTAQLDFGSFYAIAFDGEARWLETEFKKDSDASYTKFAVRKSLNGVPYAHSLRPRTRVNHTGTALHLKTTGETTNALEATASSTSGNASAVYAISSGPDGAGLAGYNDGGGYGIYASTNATSWARAGVLGASTNTSGIGVLGHSVEGYGVKGTIESWDWGTGIYGESFGGPAGSFSSRGVGATVFITTAYGTGYQALYTSGSGHVEGDLTWKAKTSYISVPAAAFQPSIFGDVSPFLGDPHHINTGDKLVIGSHNHDVYDYVAPVKLPQGATVTRLIFYWYDTHSSDNASVRLYCDSNEMAGATSSTGGYSSSEDTTISYATIDNWNYTYYLETTLPTQSNVWLRFVVIEYALTQPY